MGWLDIFRRSSKVNTSVPEATYTAEQKIAVGANAQEYEEKNYQTFNNGNITFSGELSGFNYDSILRDKQSNIHQLYQLADYYADADPIIWGIIHHVYAPYTNSTPWLLTSANEKTIDIYNAYYKRIRLKEKLDAIAFEYWKYGNVFVYIMNGIPITLPVLRCRIGNVSFNGEPLVDFDCQTIYNEWRQKNYSIKENWIKDNNLEIYFKGYPPEVQKALNEGQQYAQLNPKYTKVLQGPKESWQRYAIPFIAACLPALAKKELISKYENSLLNLGIRSFVHITYGDRNKGYDILPGGTELTEVRSIFRKAMSGFPLAVTNQLAKADVVQPDLDNLFQFNKYKDVNNDILSAGGISGILVSGLSEDGSTFASAQVSMQTAAARIESARDEICELMNRINVCIKEELEKKHVYNVKQIPEFSFMPLDMAGKKALREACTALWEKGLLSTKTLLETNGYSIEKEKAERVNEMNNGTDSSLVPREEQRASSNKKSSNPEDSAKPNDVGRPEMTDEERNSDPDNAMRGKAPKPSNPEGSMDETEIASVEATVQLTP